MRLPSAALENVLGAADAPIKFAERNAYKCIMIIMYTNGFSFIINARDTRTTTTRRKYIPIKGYMEVRENRYESTG